MKDTFYPDTMSLKVTQTEDLCVKNGENSPILYRQFSSEGMNWVSKIGYAERKAYREGAHMLLQTNESLEELIVKVLAHEPGMSAEEIRRAIAKDFKRYSEQAIFKELHKLQRVGVVVRLKREYSLSMAWALDFVNLGDVIHDRYVAKAPLSTILPDLVKRKTWKCSDFCRVSNFWVHTKTALFKQTKQNLMYEWEPHPWVHLIHHDKQLAFHRVLKRNAWRISKIIGGNTYLDKLYVPAWPKEVMRYSFARGPFAEDMNTYLSVIGDYVFSIAIEPKHNRELEALYASMSSAREIRVEKITELLYRKAKFSVKLEENPKRAKQLSRAFLEYFGPERMFSEKRIGNL